MSGYTTNPYLSYDEYYNDPYYDDPWVRAQSYYQQYSRSQPPQSSLASKIGDIGGKYAAKKTASEIGSAIAGGSGLGTAGAGISTTAPTIAGPSLMAPGISYAVPSEIGASSAAASGGSTAGTTTATATGIPAAAIATPIAFAIGAGLMDSYVTGRRRPEIRYFSEDAIAEDPEDSGYNNLLNKQFTDWGNKSEAEKKALVDKAFSAGILGMRKTKEEFSDDSGGTFTKIKPGSTYIDWGMALKKPWAYRNGEDSNTQYRQAMSKPDIEQINKAYWLKPDKKQELIDLLSQTNV